MNAASHDGPVQRLFVAELLSLSAFAEAHCMRPPSDVQQQSCSCHVTMVEQFDTHALAAGLAGIEAALGSNAQALCHRAVAERPMLADLLALLEQLPGQSL